MVEALPSVLNLVAARGLSTTPVMEEGQSNTFILSRDVVGKIYAFVSHYQGEEKKMMVDRLVGQSVN